MMATAGGWTRGLAVGAVLAAGDSIGAALYWTFLNTPESNALMLAVSGILVLATAAVAAMTINTAVLVARGAPARHSLAAAVRGGGWFVVAIVPLLAAWLAIARGDRWIADHAGEINAWVIARLGIADISRLLQAELWISRWLRWAVLPVAALSLLAQLLAEPGASRAAWLRRAFHWRTLTLATLVFVLLFALPWQLTAWRPRVPPTWIEPATAALRLGIAYALALAGAAVLVIAAARVK